MNLEEAEHLIHEMANADASARASKVYRAAAGIVLGALAAERAKREALELEVESLVTDTQDEVKNGEWHTKYKTERTRSAALEAEVKRLRDYLGDISREQYSPGTGGILAALDRMKKRALAALSTPSGIAKRVQSPTERKP